LDLFGDTYLLHSQQKNLIISEIANDNLSSEQLEEMFQSHGFLYEYGGAFLPLVLESFFQGQIDLFKFGI